MIIILLLDLLLAVAGARATTFVLADTAALLGASDAVVVGRVESIRSVQDGATLRTNISVTVDEVVKGPHTWRVNVVEPGGWLGNQRRWIHGAPTFFTGERVLLFLRRNARQELETTFLGMGKFSVVRSSQGTEFAVRNLGDARAFDPYTGQFAGSAATTTHSMEEWLPALRAMPSKQTGSGSVQPLRTAEGSRFQDNFLFAGPPGARWFSPDEGEPVAYRIGSDGDAVLGPGASVAAADVGLATWSDLACSNLQLVNAGSADPAPFGTCDGRTQIMFNDPSSEVPDPVDCSGVLAVGGVCADSNEPETLNGGIFYRITEGDVVVNNGFGGCPFWNSTNLAEILTHEIGHTVGLAHTSENPDEADPSLREATMYYAAHFDGRGAKIMTDDLAGICALYPSGRTGSVTLRRFAVSFDSSDTPGDRLVLDGVLDLDNHDFDPHTDALILNLRVAGVSLLRLTVRPGQWLANPSHTRYRYSGTTGTGTTSLLLSQASPGLLRFGVRARGLDLSAAKSEPVTMSLALGGASVTKTVPALRSGTRGRVYP